MKAATLARLTRILAIGLLAFAAATEAATIWTGPPLTFAKSVRDTGTAVAQDRLSPQVWLTRGNTRGLFNAKQEGAYSSTSPEGTEWAYGTTAALASLNFTSWLTWHGKCPPCAIGKNAVVHLIAEDIYIDIRILSWDSGQGNFSYQRATPSDDATASWTTAIEYYHSDFDHFFVTASREEAAALDAAKAPGGWARTGQSYPVYTQDTAGRMPVCRFFSTAFTPKSSHFYTADPAECAQLKTNAAWQYEGSAFFADPPAGGSCLAGKAPLHRLYNDGQGGAPNHRYTTCANIRDRMVAKGWVYEGAPMCVAAKSDECITDFSFGALPGMPRNVVVTPGSSNVTLTFAPPLSDGGLPIIGYTASCGSAGLSRTGTNATSPVTVRGLPNGTISACSVFATNALGDGPPTVPVLAIPVAPVASARNALFIPPLLNPTAGSGTLTYDLTLAPSSKQFLSGPATATYSYNANAIMGPTLVMNKGEIVRMQLRNALAEDTTTHWHGLLLPGAADGGPHSVIAAGDTWLTPAFPVANNASTYWYHPHMHEMTQKQVTMGAAGFIIVRDAEEASLALPRTYGIDDIPLALTSRRFTTVGGVANQFQTSATAYGDVMLTNGTTNAEVTLPKQVVRLRVLNAEIERDYNLGFNDGRTFYVIGNDGGLLSAPVPVTHLIVAPGERYEILVNLTTDTVGNQLDLEAQNGPDSGLLPGFAGYEDATSGEMGSLLNYRTFTVLHIRVGAATFGPVTAVPAKLAQNAGLAALTPGNATQLRTVGITGGGGDGPFAFNGLSFDLQRIDQAVTVGTTEAWTVGAGTVISHSFHIHGVQFRIVARNGSASEVKASEQGWKDTFYLPIGESVTFVVRFGETADAAYPFMYHCHMLNHEDEGLMGQFTVQ